jgi:hypothetical protein
MKIRIYSLSCFLTLFLRDQSRIADTITTCTRDTTKPTIIGPVFAYEKKLENFKLSISRPWIKK